MNRWGRNWTGAAGVAALLLTVTLTGCKPDKAVQQGANGEPAPTRAAAPVVPLNPATLGDVKGVVRFSGRAPAPVRIDMSQDPACSMTGGENFSEQYVVHGGKLANVYVYVKSGPPQAMNLPPANAAPVVLDQKGCRYQPHVIAVMKGEPVEFRNSDVTMHNIHTMPVVVGNETVDISQGPKGGPVVRSFPKAEVMMPVRCNNHPWMNAFINVAPTRFFVVTGTDGSFSMTGLPAGTYTLGAAQEKMGEQTMTVTVDPKQTATADFTFKQK